MAAPKNVVKNQIRLKSLLRRFLPVLCLTAVYSFDTRAEASGCRLYVADLSQENVGAWRAFGYEVVEQKSLVTLKSDQLAPLLTNQSFALRRARGKDEFLLSTSNGRYSSRWEPLSLQAPIAQQAPSAAYKCELMKQRVSFFLDSRKAIEDTFRILTEQPIQRTRGEVILDMERSYLVHTGQTRFENSKAKQKYLEILGKVKTLAQGNSSDFFARWKQVRQLIYANEAYNLDYCREAASMTEGMVENCFNCQGETHLMAALFEDAGFKSPDGWQFGIQHFADHVRPVLYDVKAKKTYDLVGGGFGEFRGSIVNKETLYQGLWRGHGALRRPRENEVIDKLPVEYVYSNRFCLLTLFGNARLKTQANDWVGVTACDFYIEGEAPEKTDNQSKTGDDFVEQNIPVPVNSREPKNESFGESFFDQMANTFSGLFKGIGGGGGAWFGRTAQGDGKSTFEAMQVDLILLAENQIPEERDIILDAVAKNRLTPQMSKLYSIEAFVTGLGATHLRFDPKHREQQWDAMIFPMYVELTKQSHPMAIQVGMLKDPFFMQLSRCLKIEAICVYVTNEKLADELKAKSNIERVKTVSTIIKDFYLRSAQALPAPPRPGDSPTQIVQSWGKYRNYDAFDEFLLAYRAMELWPNSIIMGQSPAGLDVLVGGYQWNTVLQKRTPTPLSEALGYAISNSVMTKEFKQIIDLMKTIEDHPVETLRVIDGLDTFSRYITAEIFRDLSSLVPSFSNFSFFDVTLLNELSPISIFEGIYGKLLISTLTHPKYFFTVEPERDEIPPHRPYYPKTIRDPEVRDEMLQAKDPFDKGPDINLPVWPGAEEACKGRTGYVLQGAITIKCGQLGVVEGADQKDEDDRSQKGVDGGGRDGLPRGNVEGKGQQTQVGLIREESDGQDSQGQLVQPKELSEAELKYIPQVGVTEVEQGVVDGAEQAIYDPREEVHLKPETWAILLGNSERSRGINEYSIQNEPQIKVLLHHTYRAKLRKVYEEARGRTGFLTFFPWDLEEGVLNISDSQFNQLVSLYYSDKSKLGPVLESTVKYSRDIYLGYRQHAYFKAALDELHNRPKEGVVKFTSQPARLEEVSEKIEQYFTSMALDAPYELPFYLETDEGKKLLPRFLGNTVSIAAEKSVNPGAPHPNTFVRRAGTGRAAVVANGPHMYMVKRSGEPTSERTVTFMKLGGEMTPDDLYILIEELLFSSDIETSLRPGFDVGI